MGLISNGTTIFDAGAIDSGLAKGAMTFIKKLTASSSATLSFVNGASSVVLDGTYKEYVFILNNIHPATDAVNTTFQCSTDGGSNYNTSLTSTFFRVAHDEGNTFGNISYGAAYSQSNENAFQILNYSTGNDADQSATGILHLFDPSNTTFVKHFIYRGQDAGNADITNSRFVSGYFNTTSAINAIQFKMSADEIDTGTITMYGIA